MFRHPRQQQTDRYVKALYNYKIGHPAAAAKILLLFVAAMVLFLAFLSLLSYAFRLLGF